MDHFIGNWWSSSDADVVPAGDGAKGYKGATFHAPGTNFKVHADIVKHVYDKGKGAGKKEEMGSPLYNRGVVNAMFSAEAIRTAMKGAKGRCPRRADALGFENLNLTEKRLEEIGMKASPTRSRSRARTTRAAARSSSSSGTARSGTSSRTGSSP